MIDKLQHAISPNEALLQQQADRIKNGAHTPGQLQQAADDFEALFVYFMLQSMRKTIVKSELTDSGMGGEVMESLFDQELSQKIAAGAKLGIAELLQQGLSGEGGVAVPRHQPLNGLMPLQRLPDVRRVHGVLQTVQPQPSPPAPALKEKDYYLNLPLRQRLAEFEEHIQGAAQKYRVDPELVRAVIAAESAGNPHAVSRKGARGLMQLMDPTARDLKVQNPFDPKENIYGGTRYLSRLLRAYDGDMELALAGYNAGPGNVRKYNGIPPFKETQAYIRRVQHYYQKFSSTMAAR